MPPSRFSAHHDPSGRFRNPWPGMPLPGLGGMLRWTLERARRGRLGFAGVGTAPALAQPSVHLPRGGDAECRVTWIGHSTFLLQVDGLNVLTDPIWSDRASPVTWAGPRRLVPPGIALDALPPIDLVLQSHDHYDHFDDRTIRALAARFPDARWCAPLGLGAALRTRGAGEVIERDWYGDADVGGARITCVPARHFSGRSIARRNDSLWCGWVLRAAGHCIYFVGDTGHHPDFGEIARRAGPFDAILMPIGAYDPRWFMRPVHVDPEEAVDAYESLSSVHHSAPPVMIAMHWGTFVLTDEPVDEPPRRVRAAWTARGLDSERLWVLAPGETRVLER